MSHIHIPDGILPFPLWILGYLGTFLILFVLLKRVQVESMRSKIPLAGVAAAVMLLSMSIPLGFIPLHFSLAVLCGILLGPGLGFIIVFVVNFILALVGHGGITVVGLNTLIIGSEVLVGYYLFKKLGEKFSAAPAAFIAVVIGLALSVTLMVGVVSTTVSLAEALPHSHHDHVFHDDHDVHNDLDSHSNSDEHSQLTHEEAHGDEVDVHHDHEHELAEAVSRVNYIFFTGWGAIAAILSLGIALEATVTALIVRYLAKVRPDFLPTASDSVFKE
ncbi:MAG: energy-coupling factor ABC transporter permease [Bacillota bacterium]